MNTQRQHNASLTGIYTLLISMHCAHWLRGPRRLFACLFACLFVLISWINEGSPSPSPPLHQADLVCAQEVQARPVAELSKLGCRLVWRENPSAVQSQCKRCERMQPLFSVQTRLHRPPAGQSNTHLLVPAFVDLFYFRRKLVGKAGTLCLAYVVCFFSFKKKKMELASLQRIMYWLYKWGVASQSPKTAFLGPVHDLLSLTEKWKCNSECCFIGIWGRKKKQE